MSLPEGWIVAAYAFPIPHRGSELRLERCEGIGPAPHYAPVTRWALRFGALVWTKAHAMEYEPQPSSRDDDFIERARWATAEEAFAEAVEHTIPFLSKRSQAARS